VSAIIKEPIIVVALMYLAYILVIVGVVFLFLIMVNRVDGFTNLSETTGYPTSQLCKMPLTSPLPELSGPADSTLSSPRVPYNLLGDYLAPAEGRLANLSSECAYIADGQRRIEKAGSYGQITNNYKHKNPDNGSTWLHELSVSFYK
jgi:hypothetical protein